MILPVASRPLLVNLITAMSLFVAVRARAQPVRLDERDLKAAFLYNFAQFVTWPPATFEAADTPIVIGVLGDDPFGSVLDDLVNREVVSGRPLTVRRYRRVEDAAGCHILFMGPRPPDQYARVLEQLRGRAVLTVGDTDDFSKLGGMIRFRTDGNRVRLQVNLDVARSVNLVISSNLLRGADIVSGGERTP